MAGASKGAQKKKATTAPKKKGGRTVALAPLDQAAAIVHATFHGDEAAAEYFNISVRSLRRYRSNMQDDEELAAGVRYRIMQVADRDGWASSATETIRDAMKYIRKFCVDTDPTPAGLLALQGLLAILLDATIALKMLDEATTPDSENDRTAPASAGAVAGIQNAWISPATGSA